MPKRKQRPVEYYEAKIRKLQKKIVDKVENNQDIDAEDVYAVDVSVEPDPMALEPELVPNLDPSTEPELVAGSQQTLAPVEANIQPEEPLKASVQPELDPELDPELLSALGEAAGDVSVYGDKIHSSLSQRWIPILKKGILKEAKTKLINEYLIPDNCRLLKAPILNPEISAAVAEVVRNRDKSIQARQDQLGHGIAAISKAISLLLLGNDKVQAIKILSEGCRLLTDLHYMQTQLRTKLITPCLQKSILCVIEDQDRDETLFGVDLPEKIKSSKAIEKQGHQIKKVPNRSTATVTQPAPRPRYQENWQGPPRYPSASRGGRGGLARPVPQQYRRTPMNPAKMAPASRMPFNQNKQHAPRQ